MPKQREMLRKIVALKRQSAEQRVRAIQIEVDRIESGIAERTASLRALDETKAGFEALSLAEENGHARKLIADTRAGQTALEIKRAELHEAREALKHVFHSEERLSRTSRAG